MDFTVPTVLCEIMGRHGSDKGHIDVTQSHHNYTVFYHHLFEDCRYQPLRIFELGLGTNNPHLPSNMGVHGQPGASLRGWAEFFPNARIFGADIDKDILFQTDRIHTYFCDQTDPAIITQMWTNNRDLHEEPFDIIIEDGLHTFEANKCFFENSIHKLAKGGIYVMEDILVHEIPLFETQIERWKQTYPHLTFRFERLPSLVNQMDNNLLIVQYYYSLATL